MPVPASNRIASRYVFEIRFRIRVIQGTYERLVGGWSRDLSESGLAAFVAEELQVGDKVVLELPIAGEKKLAIPARVARRLGTQYGFQFTALGMEQRRTLQQAMRGEPLP
jgi:hypothetical protein